MYVCMALNFLIVSYSVKRTLLNQCSQQALTLILNQFSLSFCSEDVDCLIYLADF